MNVEVADEGEGEVKEEEREEVKEEEEEVVEVKEEEEEVVEEEEEREEVKEEEEEPPKREISEKEMDDQFLHLCIRVPFNFARYSIVLPRSGRRGLAHADIYIPHQVPLPHRIHQ